MNQPVLSAVTGGLMLTIAHRDGELSLLAMTAASAPLLLARGPVTPEAVAGLRALADVAEAELAVARVEADPQGSLI